MDSQKIAITDAIPRPLIEGESVISLMTLTNPTTHEDIITKGETYKITEVDESPKLSPKGVYWFTTNGINRFCPIEHMGDIFVPFLNNSDDIKRVMEINDKMRHINKIVDTIEEVLRSIDRLIIKNSSINESLPDHEKYLDNINTHYQSIINEYNEELKTLKEERESIQKEYDSLVEKIAQ